MREMRNAHKMLDSKPEEERPLEKTGQKWKDNIEVVPKETGFEDVA
jgi:hypothetical protein